MENISSQFHHTVDGCKILHQFIGKHPVDHSISNIQIWWCRILKNHHTMSPPQWVESLLDGLRPHRKMLPCYHAWFRNGCVEKNLPRWFFVIDNARDGNLLYPKNPGVRPKIQVSKYKCHKGLKYKIQMSKKKCQIFGAFPPKYKCHKGLKECFVASAIFMVSFSKGWTWW